MDDLSFENLDSDALKKLNAATPHLNDLKEERKELLVVMADQGKLINKNRKKRKRKKRR